MIGFFWGGWGFANPAGLFLGLLALPIIALHILKPRRVRQVVSAVFLWAKVERPVTAAQPWQRLIPSWLLAAQVAAALLLAIAVADPVRLTPLALGEHTIFVIDGSSSMQATDGLPSRLEEAAARAKELRRQLPAGGEASLIEAGQNARALLTRSGDVGAFDTAVGGIEPYDGEADFVDAFALAAGLNAGDRPTRVVLVSDGGVEADDLRLAPEGTRYERVGSSATNRGIGQMVVEPADGGLVARLSVRHYGGPAADVPLRIDVDGVTVDRQVVSLEQGDLKNISVRIPLGEKVEAFLESDDAYDLDDRALATVSRRAELDVLVIGPPNAFLDTALEVVPSVVVERRESGLPQPADWGAYDLVVFDRTTPPSEVDVPMWLIAPPGGGAGFVVTGDAERPVLTLIQAASSLVNGLDLSEVLFARSQTLTMPADAELVLGAENAPLLARVRPGPTTGGVDAVYQSFAIDESNLPLQVAFPIIVDRILTELSGAALPPARLPIGAWLPIDPRAEATVTDPEGTTTSVSPGTARVAASKVGFWRIDQRGVGSDDEQAPSITVAVNHLTAESSIQPAPDLPLAQEFNRQTGQGTQAEVPLRRWVIAGLLFVLVAEWLLAGRRIGVSRRQWHLAQWLRVAVAISLLATFFDVGFNRSSDDLVTVFVVDGSDSMAVHRSDAESFVANALVEMPEKARAGIVAFGRSARLENLVSEDPSFAGVTVQVDSEGTDLASALRLGAASLPNDGRGRLVLLTDGRSTNGDLFGEVERLAQDGVPVDLVLYDAEVGADVAVGSIDVPASAQVGEKVEVVASVYSSVATSAQVVLRRDGEELDSQTVELDPGDNRVVFSDVLSDDSASVMRYQVDVQAAVDPVSQNNRAFAAIPVSGAERVLLVAGDGTGPTDPGAPIEAALDAAGMPYDLVPTDEIPPLDELVRYSSIVMINVDAFDLSSATVDSLTTVVRDLGRGMVVIGGNHSYALGGYLDSPFEELLPVISEVTDPLRRQTVAEVFAIDTSGSMGACHCNEEGENGLGGGNRINGGIEKTAIARNATARAIAALNATDEVGVLTMDNSDRWVIDLQASPSQETVDEGLALLAPNGPTVLRTGLDSAADQLRQSNAALKHIILFSDGFTEPRDLTILVERATALYDEGITVSVVATGEGAASDLEPIAVAGGGRFYPGRNLEQIPDLLVQEAVVASRSFVNEGDFAPTVTSAARTVRSLTEAPLINGYLATTAKSTARVDLRIGPDQDPLLVSWQTGLGRVSAWTSDSGQRWNQPWAAWSGYPDFWSRVIKETFPTASDGGGVAATIEGDQIMLRLEGANPWEDEARAVARVTAPDGTSQEVPLERIDGETFTAAAPIDLAGVYAVGATVSEGDETVWTGIGLSTRSYPAEYSPTSTVDPSLGQLSAATGGRIGMSASSVFSDEGTTAGQRWVDLATWLLWFAVLAWPVAVAVSRLAWRRGTLAVVESTASRTVRQLQRRLPKIDRPYRAEAPQNSRPSSSDQSFVAPSAAATVESPPTTPTQDRSTPTEPPTPLAPPSGSDPVDDGGSTLDQLLRNKRNR